MRKVSALGRNNEAQPRVLLHLKPIVSPLYFLTFYCDPDNSEVMGSVFFKKVILTLLIRILILVNPMNKASLKRFLPLKWMHFTQVNPVTETKLNRSYLIQHLNRKIYLTNRDFSIN